MPEHTRPIRIVTIGGGSGQPSLLRALSQYSDVELGAVVTTMDSGGSSGILREQYGIVPPGDIRRCLSALSPLPHIDDWWNYRGVCGVGSGHPVGNLVLAQLAERSRSMTAAIREIETLFHARGSVHPVSDRAGVLCARLTDGSTVVGEHEIDVAPEGRAAIAEVFLETSIHISSEAQIALERADLIVLSFGDVLTSLIPNLLVDGVVDAIAKNAAPVVLVCNRSTKRGETDGWSHMDYIECVTKYLSPAKLSAVIVDNYTVPVPQPHEAFIHSLLPQEFECITDNFASDIHPERLSPEKVATAIMSYARLR